MQHPILQKNARLLLSLPRVKESLVASVIGSCREDEIISIYTFASSIIKQPKNSELLGVPFM